MKTCLIFFLSFAILLLSEMESTTFTFENNCRYTVWPGTQTIAGKPQLSSTGFELPSGESSSLDVQPPWTGRFWGRTHCSTDSAGKFICGSGDCDSGQVACNGSAPSPPTTLVEPALAENFGQDDYDISLIDGFNLPISMTPIGGSGDCRETSCPGNVNEVCPSELAVKGPDGGIVGCKSACSVFYRPEYCCIGKFSTPATCPPTEYSKIFKAECTQAYSYVFDDPSNTFTCSGGPNYKITFCP